MAGHDTVSSQLYATPMGCTACINSLGQGRWGRGVTTLEVATRGGAVLFPDGPVRDGGTQGERGREVLVTWGDTTPGPVSYLRCGCACMRHPHSPCEAPLWGGWGYCSMYREIPRRVQTQAEGLGQAPSHAGLPTTNYCQYLRGEGYQCPPHAP